MAQNKIKTIWLFLCLLLSFELAQSGLVSNLENGKVCILSAQCNSKCCQHAKFYSIARCAPKAAENLQCSYEGIPTIYYYCPCEIGLSCEINIIAGSHTNTDFGYCKDPNKAHK
ncbi:colipase, partial [Pristimantis euphronides]